LTRFPFKRKAERVPDVAVLEDPLAAAIALDPLRSRMLAELGREPASAAGLAARLGLPRQYVRHHLVTLEGQGLVVEVDRRRHGGITERVLAASATAYVVSPAALGPAAAEPSKVPDRLSAAYLIALAARAVREVGGLVRGAERAGKPLPTLSVDADVRFATPEDRAAFAAELAAAVRTLAARYHDESAGNGRWYRVVALSHPRPPEAASEGAAP
jgi:DNA-binding transcriptional ArsR family regulator